MLNRSMTPTELRYANIMMLVVTLVASIFLVWDFYISIAKDVPSLGILGYLTGPIFAHKLSEILIAGVWLWFAFMYNHEKANLWPRWMPQYLYYRFLHLTAIVALWAMVLATYAWTILNLGTSAQTTNIANPPGIGVDGLAWRYYLGALVIAGGIYVMLAMRKIVNFQQAQ